MTVVDLSVSISSSNDLYPFDFNFSFSPSIDISDDLTEQFCNHVSHFLCSELRSLFYKNDSENNSDDKSLR